MSLNTAHLHGGHRNSFLENFRRLYRFVLNIDQMEKISKFLFEGIYYFQS